MDLDRAPAAPRTRARARLSAPGSPVCTPDWLALREPADHAARSGALAAALDAHLDDPAVIRDLGCGTGSMGRWLAPRLTVTQRWFTHDRDADLAHRAAASLDGPDTVRGDGSGSAALRVRADGSGSAALRVRATPVVGSVTATDPGTPGLTAGEIVGTDAVVCSALLDLLTAEEIEALVDACAAAGAAVLWTLSVSGHVRLDPVDPLDVEVAAAFDAHQRRAGLAGPDAPRLAADALARAGYAVRQEATPWRLRPGELAREWLRGWCDAAAEQDPDLDVDGYLTRRLAVGFAVEVGHTDLLGLPR